MIDVEKMIASDEGKSLKVYPCSEGFKTVGIGHNLDSDSALDILNRHLDIGDRITEAECSALFRRDIANVYAGIKRNMPYFDDLEDKYKPVLINMIFQMGINGVLKFVHTLACMIKDDVEGAINGIRASKYHKQTTDRAERMVKLIKGEKVPEYEIF
jgi:lysozyme